MGSVAGCVARIILRQGKSFAVFVRRRSQTGSFEDVIDYKRVSEYELGKNEPPLAVLLSYARAAEVCFGVLIDDALHLPARLPAKPKRTRQRLFEQALEVSHKGISFGRAAQTRRVSSIELPL